MAIKVKIGDTKPDPIVYKVEEPERKHEAQIKLKARKTLDGNIMIFDHKDIDIVLMLEKKKIVTFAKDELGDHVYEAQDRFFKYLIKKGVVDFESIQGGNVYSSMEGAILESKEYNPSQVALFAINKFIEQEKPYFEFERSFDEKEEQRLAEPDASESTEWDPEKYHSNSKGSMKPGVMPYGLANIYR